MLAALAERAIITNQSARASQMKSPTAHVAQRKGRPGSVVAVPAFRGEPVGLAYAVVDRHPVLEVSFLLRFLLAHDPDELSRRILGEPPELGAV